MKLAIYQKDESGSIKFKGFEDWESEKDYLIHCCRINYTGVVEEMVGWQHSIVTWYGDVGIAK